MGIACCGPQTDFEVLAPVGRDHEGKAQEFLPGNGGGVKSRLPRCRQGIVVVKGTVRILTKLGDIDNGVGSLHVESNEDDGPEGIDTPDTSPLVFSE